MPKLIQKKLKGLLAKFFFFVMESYLISPKKVLQISDKNRGDIRGLPEKKINIAFFQQLWR